MASFLTALANIGNQYAEGRVAGQEEKEKLAQEKVRTGLEQQQQDYQQKYLDYQMQMLANQEKTGQILNTKYGPYDVTHGRWIPPPQLDVHAAGIEGLKRAMQTAKSSPELMQEAQDIYEATLAEDPANPAKALTVARSHWKSEQDKLNQQAYQEKRDRQTRADRLQDRLMTLVEQHNLALEKPTAEEYRRADLAQNMNENMDTLEDILNRRPELFGPVGSGGWMGLGGAGTQVRQFFGTSDPDIASLRGIRDFLGKASMGAHGMRNGRLVYESADAITGAFRDTPDAMRRSIQTARKSVGTFTKDIEDKVQGLGLQAIGLTVGPDGRVTVSQPGTTNQTGGPTLDMDKLNKRLDTLFPPQPKPSGGPQ